MKRTKNNKLYLLLSILVICALLVYFVFFKGIYASSNRIVGPYRNAEIYEDFLDYDSWQIGENLYGEPIFCFEDNAFQFIKLRYKNEINDIYVNYNIENKLNKTNFIKYKNIIENNNLKENKNYNDLYDLLELYENGQKRWIYKIGYGFIRTYK